MNFKLKSTGARIFILFLLHVFADFYLGLLLPIQEPTMTEHLAVSLTLVGIIYFVCNITVNAIQPVAGFILPARGLPKLLFWGVFFATATAFIGLTCNYWLVMLMAFVAAVAVGVLHPEGVMTIQSLTRKNKGLAVSFFMSGGVFGYSIGIFISGWWAQNMGLNFFWLLALPGLFVALLIYLSGLSSYHTTEQERKQDEEASSRNIPFLPVFLLAVSLASTMVLIARFTPIYFVREYGRDFQGLGATVVSMIFLACSLGSYLWGWLSSRFGYGRMIILAQLAGAPFFLLLLISGNPYICIPWGICIGAGLGGVFPLSVVLSGQSKGLSRRLRLGLGIGGAWGTGELLCMFAIKYVDSFEPGMVRPVLEVMGVCWLLIAFTVVMAIYIAGHERRELALTSKRGL